MIWKVDREKRLSEKRLPSLPAASGNLNFWNSLTPRDLQTPTSEKILDSLSEANRDLGIHALRASNPINMEVQLWWLFHPKSDQQKTVFGDAVLLYLWHSTIPWCIFGLLWLNFCPSFLLIPQFNPHWLMN